MNHRFPQGKWGGGEGQWNCDMALTFPCLLISLGVPATQELRKLSLSLKGKLCLLRT